MSRDAPSAGAPSALDGLLARRGPCLVLAGIYFSLAERLGVDAVPVATPRHVFIREGGTAAASGGLAARLDAERSGAMRPRNIELLERGAERSDGSYLSQEKAPGDDPRSGQLLRVLAPRAFLAYLLNNHAVTLRVAGDVKGARRTYKRALHLDPDCQPCHFNFANLLAAEGRRDDALRHSDRALALQPWDEEAETNRRILRGRGTRAGDKGLDTCPSARVDCDCGVSSRGTETREQMLRRHGPPAGFHACGAAILDARFSGRQPHDAPPPRGLSMPCRGVGTKWDHWRCSPSFAIQAAAGRPFG